MFQSSVKVIQIHVLQREPVLSLGLASALREQADFEVHLGDYAPSGMRPGEHVVISDYPTAMSLVAAGAVRHGARLIVMTMQDREHELRSALEAGIQGYLLLGCNTAELVEAVRVVGRGNKYLCLQAAQRMADSLTRESLTSREFEVLHLLSTGCCNKTIARDLDIALGTVKAHVKAIMSKLEARSRTQAVTVAAKRGLIDEASAGQVRSGAYNGGARMMSMQMA